MSKATGHSSPPTSLTDETKNEVLERVLKALDRKFYRPELLGPLWDAAVHEHRPNIESAITQSGFEQAVTKLLKTLETSHLGFFHDSAHRASSRAALNATFMAAETAYGRRWAFQDVHEGGAAALGGLEPGNILLRVDGNAVVPDEHPAFAMGSTTAIDYLANDGSERSTSVSVQRPKGKRLHFAEPDLVIAKRLPTGVGYLKVSMFPGMVGVDVAEEMLRAVGQLGDVAKLIVDLRGNTGGGVGSLRLMSLLTESRIPVGFSPGRKWAGRNLMQEKAGFPRLGAIPSTKPGLWMLGLRFLPSLLSGTPIVLQTEGLGRRPYHGRVVLLVDRHTASAAEMVVMFAKENRLAVVVGEETAGRLLAASSVKVGHGFRLALPTGAYHTWEGSTLEGSPIEPDVVAAFQLAKRREGVDTQLEKAVQALADMD